MADREKVLRFFRSGGDEDLAAKLLDLAETVQKSRKFKVSDFLDPHGLSVAEIVAANVDNIKVEVNGGFQNPERAKAAFVSEEFFGKPDFALECFQVEWDKRYYTLTHRDILGAFMGLGCKREILGDIIFIPEGAQFVADKAFEAYITSNLTQIGAAPVSLKIIAPSELQQREEQVKVISATVSALRLDAVAAAGYGVSRSRMAEEIKSQNVKVNWKEAKNAAQSVGEGDILSFRNRGRVEVAEVRGTTKKGRISITLKRYI
ncbi:MAG: RNA-binding protein [Negativicutes bacterium]|nr:RNA-binding protein [Negativicutes bacterium]